MNRITNADLDMAFGRYSRALESMGIRKEGCELVYGRLYGQCYAVAWRNRENGGMSDAPGSIVVNTKRELFNQLLTAARTLVDAFWELSDSE